LPYGAHERRRAGVDVDAYPTTLSNLFGVAGILVPLGMILAGIATVRVGGWRGWRRLVPLACGIYAVVLIPLLFSSIDKLGIAAFFFAFGVVSYATYSQPEPDAAAIGAASAATA